jgi:hypothetical protein
MPSDFGVLNYCPINSHLLPLLNARNAAAPRLCVGVKCFMAAGIRNTMTQSV